MALRLKGQEVSLNLVSATQSLEASVSDVKSNDIQFDMDIVSEGYLGQTTEQKDDIFKGVSGKFELHIRSADILAVIQRIIERSKRRLPGERFQIVVTFAFPEGGRRRVVIPDAKFGNIPISTSSRDDYTMVTFEFAADDARILAA